MNAIRRVAIGSRPYVGGRTERSGAVPGFAGGVSQRPPTPAHRLYRGCNTGTRGPPPAHPRLHRLDRHAGARHRRARADELELVGLSRRALVGGARRAGARARRRAHRAGRRGRRRRAPPRRGPTARCSPAPRGSCGWCSSPGADLVLNALVGSAGLGPTVATLGEGIDLALANKESLVVGGELVTAARRGHRRADHARRLRALGAAPAPRGRARRDRRPARAHRQRRAVPRAHARPSSPDVTVEEALEHPTWAMGGKITIDSATLMNKGLELIEAHHLFGTPYERIDVVVHPQSIVHSYVQLCDGAALAHLGHPDMRVPISYALHHPERVDVPVAPLDLAEVGALTFEPRRQRRVPVPAPRARGRAGGRHRAVRAQRRQRDRRPRVPATGASTSSASPAVIEETLERAARRSRCARSSRSTRPTARRARVAAELVDADRSRA